MKLKAKEPVKLRQKKLAGGSVSLYLDIYSEGQRQYEFLKLYLVPERTKADKEQNRQTLELATAIKARRIVELQSGRFSFNTSTGAAVRFMEYFDSLGQRRKAPTSRQAWAACLKYMRIYEPDHNITIGNITTGWVRGFRDWLDNEARAWTIDGRMSHRPDQGLKASTKALYFQKLVACLNEAVKAGLIDRSPAMGVEGFKVEGAERVFLTLDEVRQLAATPCDYPELKRAFLFSCLTGLRWSDIEKLTWSNVQVIPAGTRIVFTQKKTGGLEYLDISSQAAELMGERQAGSESVFGLNMSGSMANYNLRVWGAAAHIEKHLTFHVGRHTFAIMMLDLGTDIYTVSKLLGHRDLSTTQIYARVLDKNKQAAVEKIPDIFN